MSARDDAEGLPCTLGPVETALARRAFLAVAAARTALDGTEHTATLDALERALAPLTEGQGGADDVGAAVVLLRAVGVAATLDAPVAAPSPAPAPGPGDLAVTIMLRAEGVEALRAVVGVHPLPWSLDGRELVDADGAAIVAAERATPRAVRDLVLHLAAVVVEQAAAVAKGGPSR